MDALLAVFGRAHPLVLHLPIGVFAALFALEALAKLRGRALADGVRGPLIGFTALVALLSAASGWTLASGPGYSGETLELHRWLGVSVAGFTLAAALAQRAGARKLYGVALVVCAPVLVVAGHQGASLTHGAGFLTEPLRRRAEEPAAPAVAEPGAEVEPEERAPTDDGPVWSRDVAPVLESNCWSCHGDAKHKGGLAMHTPAALLAGGESGPALVAGDPDASLLLQRAELPLDDMDHMPPEGKPQPSAEELALLRAWIAAGAVFDTAPDARPAREAEAPAPTPDASEDAAAAPAPDAQALAELERALVHVEAMPAGSDALWIDFAATAETVDDATVARLVGPLREFVVELSLARTRTGDATASFAAELPRLRRLDLRGTAVTDAGVAALAESATLTELVLAQTAVGDGAVPSLARMPALAHVWLWKSAVSEDGLARLREARPELAIDDGATPDAAVLEQEGKPTFTSDRPLPGQEAARAAGLAPVNEHCPVSGDPVNPKYAVVHDGRVIGFCCPNCPKTFWDDPETYAAALE